MLNWIFALTLLFILIAITAVSVVLGRAFGTYQIKNHIQSKREAVAVAEGTVFAILGLLIAFSFSAAYDRFELRKVHIISEANAYVTAYQRVSLMAPQTQADLRETIRQYLQARIAVYKKLPHIYKMKPELDNVSRIEDQLWEKTVAACNITNIPVSTEMFVPAIGAMFDQANEGYFLAHVHSPAFVFFLLIGLTVLGAFLTGYSMAESQHKHSLHIISFILISTLTIFLIINLEVPRLGIIRIDRFDRVLLDILDKWSQPGTKTAV